MPRQGRTFRAGRLLRTDLKPTEYSERPPRMIKRKIVIAHRGASGYLPEHTLAAKALAYGLGADYLEQDLVLTQDNQLIVLHDVHLDTVTDVASVFPGRNRKDGRYYALDLTLAEIKTLRVQERIDLTTNRVVFPGRFPRGHSEFRVPSLEEELQLVQGLNRSTGRSVGIYPEIKSPAWHRLQGRDISRLVLEMLARYGYADRESLAYVQCFDAAETRRLRTELQCQLRLIQLLGENSWQEAPTDFDALRTPAGLATVAEYADGIGPALDQVLDGVGADGRAQRTGLVEQAHQHGLEVHAYTFRTDALPPYARDATELLRMAYVEANLDGLFCDFPDVAVQFLRFADS